MSIEKLTEKKRKLMRALSSTKSPHHSKELEGAVNLCDVKIARIKQRGRSLVRRAKDRLLEVVLLLSLLFLATGCIEHTMRGFGGLVNGAGQLIGGVGKDIVRATDGYAEK